MPGFLWWGQPIEEGDGYPLRIATLGLLPILAEALLGVASLGLLYPEEFTPEPSGGSKGGGSFAVAKQIEADYSPKLKTDYSREKVMASALLFMGYQMTTGRR